MTRPDPPGIHHTTSGHGAASPGASTVVSHCLGHHPAPHMCTFPFCLYVSTFSLLKGKKPNRCLKNAGCSCCCLGVLWKWPLWHGAGALPVCFCPDAAEPGECQPPQDEKKKIQMVFPTILAPLPQTGESPCRHKPPSCQCRTGNTSPVQSQAADTENVLKTPLLLPKTFKLFRALGPTPSKNTNKHSMKSEPH